MSRAYRIRVRESLRRVISAEDKVSTQLEVLDILPCEQMAELLRQELAGRGFERDGAEMVRTRDGITVRVDPESGEVSVASELCEKLELEAEKETRAYTDVGPTAQKTKQALREDVQRDLEKQAETRQGNLQGKATEKLEAVVGELRKELDQAVNKVTAEALKQKAAQLGQIKEMTEDPQTGSLTIVLEV
jgi:hypothetical protein